MAEGRHFENNYISLSQSGLSDFEQIWYADANFHSEDGNLTKKNRQNVNVVQCNITFFLIFFLQF